MKNIKLYYLKKTGGSRLNYVESYTSHCNVNKETVSDWLLPSKVLQSAFVNDDFRAVYLSKFKGVDTQDIVVKVQEIGRGDLGRELRAIRKIGKMKNNNFIKYICDFKCNDEISRYKTNEGRIEKFCDGGSKKLHIIIQEYIKNGDISNFFLKNENYNNKNVIMNIIRQCICALAEAFVKYGFTHGDLHGANILISKDENLQKTKQYEIRGKKYIINMFGFEPVMIDYGKSTIGKGRSDLEIKHDIEIFLGHMADWVKKNKKYSNKLRILEEKTRKMELEEILFLISTKFLK